MAKTLSFAAVHFTVAFGVGYLLTGSVLVGSLLALVEPAVNTVAYHFHERVWNRIEARRASAAARHTIPAASCAGRRAAAYGVRASASAA
jgi:uncharacterized membrane protein